MFGGLERVFDRFDESPRTAMITCLVVMLVLFVIWACFSKWSYSECLRVGHDAHFCMAKVAGCTR